MHHWPAVTAFYNLYGYRFEEKDGGLLYEAGNSIRDSQVAIDPRSEMAVTLSEIKRMLALTAEEMKLRIVSLEYDQEEETRIALNLGHDDLASDLERLRAL